MRRPGASMLFWLAGGLALTGVVRGLVRLRSAYDLRGRTVLVTGGTRGLGLVISRMLLSRGARVAICGRDDRSLASALADLRKISPEVHGVCCDTSAPDQVDRMIEEVRGALGPVDVLINNAGAIQVGPV